VASIKFQAYERNLRRIYMLDRDQRLDPNQQVRGFASMACQAEVGLNMVRIAPGAGPASRPTWLATKPVKN
jgi:hypothetical protein